MRQDRILKIEGIDNIVADFGEKSAKCEGICEAVD